MWRVLCKHSKVKQEIYRTFSQLSFKRQIDLDQYYSLLRVSKDCSDAELRESFIDQAKDFHPDSGSPLADVVKFTQLDHAYKTVLKHRREISGQVNELSSNNVDVDDEEMFDIKHTVPQHRQYLSNEGIGFGTPGQRKRQYDLYKVHRATENINEYKIHQISSKYETRVATQERKRARKIKRQNAMERLVEDLILESMSKGEFENLPGMGKPMEKVDYHPMGDTSMYHLNKILIDDGFKPEWTLLHKEIRKEVSDSRNKLLQIRSKVGPEPVSPDRKKFWKTHLETFKCQIRDTNLQVDRLNLIVPCMWQQMAHYDADREIKKVLHMYQEKVDKGEDDIIVDESFDKPIYSAEDVSDYGVVHGLKDVFKELKAMFCSR